MKCPKCEKGYKLGEVPWWIRLKWWIKFDVLGFKRPLPKVHRTWIGGAKALEMAFGRSKMRSTEDLMIDHMNPDYKPWDQRTWWSNKK